MDVNSLVEVDLSPGLKKELNPMFRLGIPLQISLVWEGGREGKKIRFFFFLVPLIINFFSFLLGK